MASTVVATTTVPSTAVARTITGTSALWSRQIQRLRSLFCFFYFAVYFSAVNSLRNPVYQMRHYIKDDRQHGYCHYYHDAIKNSTSNQCVFARACVCVCVCVLYVVGSGTFEGSRASAIFLPHEMWLDSIHAHKLRFNQLLRCPRVTNRLRYYKTTT